MQVQVPKIQNFFEKFLHSICITEANSRCVLRLAGNPGQLVPCRVHPGPGRGTKGLKSGTSRIIRDGWQPYFGAVRNISSAFI